ncbi:hypothetical protein GCM10009838_51250 [Catenulispora subtropica]|uniref:Uncharacterized protein n=1 Tax=Catenulispora subtropica TaxID=450798 RepID=A0ABN2SAI4_9ACTN
MEEFARLHTLPVTVANGNQIIVYRAATRRWRAVGFALGVLIPAAVTGSFLITFPWALAGWFAGAAVAELRVAHLDRSPGTRASASLTPRRTSDYLPRAGRWAVPGAMACCLASAILCAVRHGAHPAGDLSEVGLWTGLGVGTGAVALAAQRHILRRPQPLASPDRTAADDAIRSRSMHVLAASGMVLVGLCVSAQLSAADILPPDNTATAVHALLGIGVPLLGRILAYWPSPPATPDSA